MFECKSCWVFKLWALKALQGLKGYIFFLFSLENRGVFPEWIREFSREIENTWISVKWKSSTSNGIVLKDVNNCLMQFNNVNLNEVIEIFYFCWNGLKTRCLILFFVVFFRREQKIFSICLSKPENNVLKNIFCCQTQKTRKIKILATVFCRKRGAGKKNLIIW